MHATTTNPQINTMRFKGKIGDIHVYVLFDSGSTHSFVDPTMLKGQSCQVVETNPMIIIVANGERMVTDSKYEVLTFIIQD